MAVTLTEAAARHVTRYIAKRGKGVGVRLGVKTTGCSGLAYKLEYADDVAPEDKVFEGHGAKMEQFCRSRAIGYARCVTSTPFQDTIVHMLRRGKLLQ